MSDTNEVMDPDEFLAHYGVKGMKWGHRKKSTEIHAARARVKKAKTALNKQEEKVAYSKPGSSARKKEQAKYDKMKVDFLNNPDRATSARMTRGETIALAFFTTPVAALAVSGGTHARSAHINSKQLAGEYKKK